METSIEQLIQQAISEAEAGNIAGAKKSLAQVVRQEPENTMAWYLLSQILDDKELSNFSLEKAINIQPEDQQVWERIKKFGQLIPPNELEASSSQPKETTNRKKPSGCSDIWLIVGIFVLLTTIGCILGFGGYCLFLRPSDASTSSEPQNDLLVSNKPDLIMTISDFENSQFCKVYECKSPGQIPSESSVDNTYFIEKYPVHNEFFIEVITVDDVITEYGMTLDPRPITSDDMKLIEVFLTSFNPEVVNPQLLEFIRQNLGNHVSQICLAESSEFGARRLWAGMVGSAPTVYVASECKK